LCHRQKTGPSNSRVRSLWNEFKTLKSVGSAPWPKDQHPRKASLSTSADGRGRVLVQPPAGHPAVMRFFEFLITPSYALIVMPYFRQPMNVSLPPETCRAYFHHLLSGVFWLHQNNVTHNDIKTANTMVEYHPSPEEIPPGQAFSPILHSIPILADFGFAEIHDAASAQKNYDKDGNLMPRFCTKNSWGTPEYLSPERARGDLHDERLSDLWSLGVTFFEIATGRTPFENEQEQFLTKEELAIYYNRTMSGSWIGTYSISHDLEDLLRAMLKPDPFLRMESADAILHPYFVDSELLQDAEADELSSMTDDLDASLGAVVLAQLQAVKAERSRMETSDTSMAEHSGSAHVLDEPSMDVDASNSRSGDQSYMTSASQAHCHGTDRSTNGHKTPDKAARHTLLGVHFPSPRDRDVEHVGHHSNNTASARSRDDEADRSVDRKGRHDPASHRHYDAAASSKNGTPDRKKTASVLSSTRRPATESKAQDSLLSPVMSKYKKSQALISGAFHGTPLSKSKVRDGPARAGTAAASSRVQTTAVISTPKLERSHQPKSPLQLQPLQQYANLSQTKQNGKHVGVDPAKAVLASRAHISPGKRDQPLLGSPIALGHTLDLADDRSFDRRVFQSPDRSAWVQSSGEEDQSTVSHDIVDVSPSQHKFKEGSRLLNFARTVRRSMSRPSVLDSASASRGADNADTYMDFKSTSSTKSRGLSFIEQRRQQAAEALEGSHDVLSSSRGQRNQIAAEDSPSSWCSAEPVSPSASASEVSFLTKSKVMPATDGRQNPHLTAQRSRPRVKSEIVSKKVKLSPAAHGRVKTDGGHESDQDENESDVSEGRRSPTVVVTQHAAARAAQMAAQRNKAALVDHAQATHQTPARQMQRKSSGRNYISTTYSPTAVAFESITGRLDAMSQHASSLLRLVEETRVTIDRSRSDAGSGARTPLADTSREVRENLNSASDDEVDEQLVTRSTSEPAKLTEGAEGRKGGGGGKQVGARPYSMYDLQPGKDGLSRGEMSGGVSAGNLASLSLSLVGDRSEGTTLVGDHSCIVPLPADPPLVRSNSQAVTGPSWSTKGGTIQHGQSRFSLIPTPSRVKTQDVVVNADGEGENADPAEPAVPALVEKVPASVTVRKHVVPRTPQVPSSAHQRAVASPQLMGSPESSQWVKVHKQDTESHGGSSMKSDKTTAQQQQQPSSSNRFSMRRTRSFVLAALAAQSQGADQQQQQQQHTGEDDVQLQQGKSEAMRRAVGDRSWSPGVTRSFMRAHSPETSMSMAEASARQHASPSHTPSSFTGAHSSVSSRHNTRHWLGYGGPNSPVTQHHAGGAAVGGAANGPAGGGGGAAGAGAVASPRTPGRAVSRLLKLIRGGGGGTPSGAQRSYEDGFRGASRADGTHDGDEYAYRQGPAS